MSSLNPEQVVTRLREAGLTLARLHVQGVFPAGYRSCMPETLRDPEDLLHAETNLRPPPAHPSDITRMDQALSWIRLIPDEMAVHRRIVGCRCLMHPISERLLFSWRRLGREFHLDHKTVKEWHEHAIRIIVVQLARPGLCSVSGGQAGPSRRKIERAIAGLVRARELV